MIAVHREVLPGGTHMVVAEMPRSPAAAIGLWLRSGSADDPPAFGGIAHFLEHLLLHERGRAAARLASEVHAAGGYLNAETGVDHVALHHVVPASGWKRVLAAQARAVRRPDLSRRAVEQERRVILQEIAWEEADPWRFLWRRLLETAFDSHPYRRPVAGVPETVARVSSNDLFACHRRVCRPSNTVLVVAGAVDAREVFRFARGRHGRLHGGDPPGTGPPRPVEPPRGALRARVFTVDPRGPGPCPSLVSVAFRTVPLAHERAPTLDLVAAILDGGRSAGPSGTPGGGTRGGRRASVRHAAFADAGLLVVRAEAEADEVAEVVRSVFAAARSLGDGGLPREEMERVHRRVQVDRAAAREAAGSVARDIGALEALGGPGHADRRARPEHVVAADVAKAARSFLTPERATIVACVPRPPGDQARAATRRTDALAADLASAAGAASVGEERRRWSVRSAGLDRGGASRVVLPGGATFVACQRPGSPLAAVALGFGGGFVDEPPGLGGCTFLLHRLLARGTRSLSGTGFADGLERLGSRPSPACDRDGFGVGATMLPRDLPAALELLLMAVAEPAFGNDELEAVRAEAVAELEGAAGDPRRRALRLVTPLVFGGHPYGRPLRGTIESLRGISLDDLLAWHRATCVPSRLVVCAAGEFHAERAAAEVERVAAGMDRGEAAVSHAGDTRKLDHRGPGRAGMTSVAERTDHPLSAVAVGFRAPPGGSPESAAMRVICAALSMRGGRLWRALRDKPPHAYAVHATHLALARAGAVVIHATLTPGTEDRTAEALTAVARSLAFGGLDAAELRRARAHAVGALELSRERCSVVAAGCAAAEAAGFGHRWFERLPDSVASVGVEDAERVAASWLAPDRGFASVTTRGRP